MRKLILAAALLACPAILRADGLPGTEGYPITGFTLQGCSNLTTGCVSATVNRTQASGGSFAWLSGVQCDTSIYCNFSVGANRLELYNSQAEMLFSYAIGNVPTSLRTPEDVSFGLARFYYWPDDTFTNSYAVVVPLGVTAVITTTPEPEALVLIGTGLLVLFGLTRRFA